MGYFLLVRYSCSCYKRPYIYLINGLTLQLGFGLSAGCRLIYPHVKIPDSFENGCRDSVNEWYHIILLPMASLSFCLLINVERRQLLGMILVAATGQFVSYGLTYDTAGSDTMGVPLIGGIVVTAMARVYAHFGGNLRPLIYIISGLLVLVPGGLGVKGMSNVWSGDVSTGLEFTFSMVMIGVCLAIGVFLSLLPRKSWLIALRKGISLSKGTARSGPEELDSNSSFVDSATVLNTPLMKTFTESDIYH